MVRLRQGDRCGHRCFNPGKEGREEGGDLNQGMAVGIKRQVDSTGTKEEESNQVSDFQMGRLTFAE